MADAILFFLLFFGPGVLGTAILFALNMYERYDKRRKLEAEAKYAAKRAAMTQEELDEERILWLQAQVPYAHETHGRWSDSCQCHAWYTVLKINLKVNPPKPQPMPTSNPIVIPISQPEKKQWVPRDQYMEEVFAGQHRDYEPTANSIRKAGVRAETDRLLQEGKLQRKYKCELCGDATAPLQKHHRSYDKPDSPYDIIWLCKPCHLKVHKE